MERPARSPGAQSQSTSGVLQRSVILAYGLASYILFLVVFLYLIGFVLDVYVPKSIDEPPRKIGALVGIIIDIALLSLFGIQHSIMARPKFKRWWEQYLWSSAERPTFVTITNLILVAIFIYWQPLRGIIWKTKSGSIGSIVLTLLSYAGFGLVVLATATPSLVNHFDLFGVRQVWMHFNNIKYKQLPFSTDGLYHYIRQPVYLGWMIAFWSTPVMTVGHALFASVWTLYMIIAIFSFHEPDLVAQLKGKYTNYKKMVPALFPIPGHSADNLESSSEYQPITGS